MKLVIDSLKRSFVFLFAGLLFGQPAGAGNSAVILDHVLLSTDLIATVVDVEDDIDLNGAPYPPTPPVPAAVNVAVTQESTLSGNHNADDSGNIFATIGAENQEDTVATIASTEKSTPAPATTVSANNLPDKAPISGN